MIISFTNVIGAIRSLGEAAQVITTNLKMWLGFETSETIGKNIYDGGITNPANGGTFTDNGNGTFTVTGDGTPNLGIGVRDFDADYLTVGGTYKFYAQGANTTVAVYDTAFNLLTSGINSVEFQATTSSIKLYISPTNGVSATYSDVEVRQLTQITPDKSGNNNVGELFTGKALEFDGSGDNVDIDFTTPVKSAVFWVKPLDTGLENIMWFGGAFAGTKSIKSNGNVIQTSGLSSVSIYVNGVQTTSVPLNQWSRVVVNFASVTPSELKFGYAFNSYGYIQLSNVQLYNENLSTDDIAYDYANPNKLVIDNPSTSLSVTNLKGYWALSEGDGLVAYDSGTNLEDEEVVNGDFATDSDWSEGAGWDIDVVNNVAIQSGGVGQLSQTGVLAAGKSYSVSVTIDSIASGTSLKVSLGSAGAELLFSNVGATTLIGSTSSSVGNQILYLLGNESGFSGSISNVSVRELTASDHGGILNGATYVDAQPRIPQLGMMNWSKGSNLVTHSENFTDNSWTKLGAGTGDFAIVTSNFDTSPIGTQNATRLQCDLNGGTTTADQSLIYDLDSSSTSQCISIYMKSNNGSNQNIYFANTFTGDDRDNAIVTTDWQRFEFKHTTSNHTFSLGLRGGTGSDDTADILIWGAQSENSSSASAYRLTDGAVTLNSTVIPNPNNTSQDIFGNAVRDRLNSFNLDGSGYSSVANSSTLQFDTDAFTIQAWIKPFSLAANNRILTKGVTGNGEFMISVGGDSASARVFAKDSSGNSLDTSNDFSSLTINSWQMITVVIDTPNDQILFYKNDGNVETKTGASWTGNFNSTQPITIGNTSSVSAGQFFDGLVSDALVYDRALSSDEVENNYNAGLSAHTN